MSWLDRLLAWLRPNPAPTPAPVKLLDASGLVAALNAERARYALAPLAESDALNHSSLTWAKYMAAREVMTHGNFASRLAAVVPGRAAGEDIAEGQRTVAEVVASWMGSTGHQANILGPYTQVGYGEATDARGVIYWVVDFAS
jgi:uncharacterized protein YkwD